MENFPYLPFVPNRKTVLRRMGSGKAQFPEALSKDIDRYLRRAQAMFHPAGKAAVFDFRHNGKGMLQIGSAMVQSALLAKMLDGSRKAYLMCASLPASEVAKISEAFGANEGLMALVLDAYASECVDGALGEIMRIKNAALARGRASAHQEAVQCGLRRPRYIGAEGVL